MTQTPEAIRSIALQLGRDTVYLEPEEERHIDGPTVVSGISAILASQFLSGFCDQARQAAYDAGKAAFDRLRKRVGEAFDGKQPVTPNRSSGRLKTAVRSPVS